MHTDILKCLLTIAGLFMALTTHSSPPFCDPQLNPSGDLGCNELSRIPFSSGLNESSYQQFDEGQYEMIDQWFHLSIENLTLAEGEQIHLIEYYNSVTRGREGLMGSLILRKAPKHFNNLRLPAYEISWHIPDTAGIGRHVRLPLLTNVASGQVPLLTEVTDLCFHMKWQTSTTEQPGFFNISIQDFNNSNYYDFTMDNWLMPNQTAPVKMVRAGIVVPALSPMQSNGYIDLKPTNFENCGY